MIRHDSVSKGLVALVAMITIYFSTWETGSALILYPVILLVLGIVLQLYFEKRIEDVDSVFEERTTKKTIYYTALVVVGLAVTGLTVAHIPAQLAGFDTILYGILMATSETLFFQGFMLNFFISKLTPSFGILTVAAMAGVFHFARYGTELSALIYVIVGFTILNWAAYRSNRLSPPMLGHIINNLLSFFR